MWQQLSQFIQQHWILLTVFSFILTVLPLIITFTIFLRLPKDHWKHFKETGSGSQSLLRKIARNSIALFMFMAGGAMLVLPGQGLLTILAALLVSDFPWRGEVINKIMQGSSVQQALNQVRNYFKREPFDF